MDSTLPIAVVLIALLLLMHSASADVFSALADMESVVRTELEFGRHLEVLVAAEERRVAQLKRYDKITTGKLINQSIVQRAFKMLVLPGRYLAGYKQLQHLTASDVSQHLANPLNSYLLIKRLTVDLRHVQRVFNQSLSHGTFSLSLSLFLSLFLYTALLTNSADRNGSAGRRHQTIVAVAHR